MGPRARDRLGRGSGGPADSAHSAGSGRRATPFRGRTVTRVLHDGSSRRFVDGVLYGGSFSRGFFTRVLHGGSSRRFSDGAARRLQVDFRMGARNYRELHVWRLCEEIRARVLAETERGGAGSISRFRNQIRSAAEDVASDIAEGFTRFHPRTFAQFVGYALSSLDEVRERTRYAHSRKYFSDAAAAEIMVLCARAEKAAKSLRQYLWSVPASDVPRDPKSVAKPKGRTIRKNRRREPP